jgi:hypothetical protein
MFEQYFDGWRVRSNFDKEYVSLFDGWLGKQRMHELDEVTESDWRKFNALIASVAERYEMQKVDCESETCSPVVDVQSVLQTYPQAMEKDPGAFLKLVIPGLDCVLTEEWDYTYIIWHKSNGAVEALKPLIASAGLYCFHD